MPAVLDKAPTKAVVTSSKTRVQLDLSSTELAAMNWLMKVCGFETRKDLFNNSVTLFDWAVAEVIAGRKVCSYDPTTGERTALSMPAFRNAESNAQSYRQAAVQEASPQAESDEDDEESYEVDDEEEDEDSHEVALAASASYSR